MEKDCKGDTDSYSSGCMTINELIPGSVLFSATRENKGKWWKKKFLGNLEKLKIQNSSETKVVVLSGTHGIIEGGNKFKTALNKDCYKNIDFYHNDLLDKVELEKNPNTDKMSFEVLNLGDLGDYGQRSANLETKLKEFCPTVVILAYCHSDQTIKRKDDLIHEALVGAKLLEDTNPPMEIYTDLVDDLKDCPLFGSVCFGGSERSSVISNEEDVEEK